MDASRDRLLWKSLGEPMFSSDRLPVDMFMMVMIFNQFDFFIEIKWLCKFILKRIFNIEEFR